jgi:hypothetical protein
MGQQIGQKFEERQHYEGEVGMWALGYLAFFFGIEFMETEHDKMAELS